MWNRRELLRALLNGILLVKHEITSKLHSFEQPCENSSKSKLRLCTNWKLFIWWAHCLNLKAMIILISSLCLQMTHHFVEYRWHFELILPHLSEAPGAPPGRSIGAWKVTTVRGAYAGPEAAQLLPKLAGQVPHQVGHKIRVQTPPPPPPPLPRVVADGISDIMKKKKFYTLQ